MPAAQSSYFTDNRVNLWREHQKDTPCGAGDGGKGVGGVGETGGGNRQNFPSHKFNGWQIFFNAFIHMAHYTGSGLNYQIPREETDSYFPEEYYKDKVMCVCV